jgi:2-keto-4-pentenoate hydratase/2-oxohepta-3-ene-1,7-dioic acid hydratase in catechol pathway
MKVANVRGRLSILDEVGVIDVEQGSKGRFSADPQAIFARWQEFVSWAAAGSHDVGAALQPLRSSELGPPVPQPAQAFGIGLNYRDHAFETGSDGPREPLVFTKFPSSIVGPGAVIELPTESVDYEAELVVVIGKNARRVAAESAWDHVAGLTLGQDLSERVVQFRGTTPQYNLGKSFPGFAPIGPYLLTPDEFVDRNDIELGCRLNGREMQRGRTSEMIFSIADLIEYLSSVVTLLPGDVIFTGTPSGIGWTRDPRVLLRPGDELITFCDPIGDLALRFRSS